MGNKAFVLVAGDRNDSAAGHWHGGVEQAVKRAIRSGYGIGRKVRVGHVDGEVVGYNIGNFGRFNGATFPLVIETEFGAVKCSLDEVAWA
ncbi:MAG: hypothetical protein R3E45_09270 [Rhodocyclaceae bacterium]|nr:hypothetical protein [Zoogloeaceae bacterium]MCP5241387.1 hypothetical protein [Zoogloeaceae bacterium]MCP5293296.1 hypothetical protein [Zoogloeaceae bacterium]MCW5616080.1 hypothetical protein [Rhodocyclaceae bacterium]